MSADMDKAVAMTDSRLKRGSMKTLNILVPMKLRGQENRDAGYAMAVLLVAMSIMAIMLTVAMPVWKQATQRDKEEELVFRGLQYSHAIGLFQKKYANAYPPNFDTLVTERFLRKKYKDPITNDDFSPILAGQTGGLQAPAPGGNRGAMSGPPAGSTAQAGSTAPQVGGGTARPAPGAAGGGPVGGIIGVTSKSRDKSIRLYKGRSHYNEWQFVFVPQVQAPGAGAPGAAVPGAGPGRGGRGGNSPFNPTGPGPIGGDRGRGAGNGRSGAGGPNRGGTPGTGTFNPFQPSNPQQPIRGGRSGG
jgi:type II secretory pathway pseudopilin PulG